jgi:hypothetical protein
VVVVETEVELETYVEEWGILEVVAGTQDEYVDYNQAGAFA